MSFFSTLMDWASVLVASDPTAVRKRRELREVHAFLKGVRPQIFKPGTRLVLPPFASALLELAAAARPLREVLEKTVLLPDARAAKRYRDILLERCFDAGTLRLMESLSYEAMKAGIDGGEDAAAVLASAEADFRLMLQVLEGPDIRNAEAEAAAFETLVELCRYDTGRILRAFDPAARPESAAYKPKFSAAEGIGLTAELTDFYAVAAPVTIGAASLDIAAVLAARASGSGDSPSQRFAKDLKTLSRLLGGVLSPTVLAALIKALREEPQFVPSLPEQRTALAGEYRDRLSRRWTEARERLLRELKEQSLSSDVSALFGSQPQGGVQTLVGYNEELNGKLQEVLGRTLHWVKPLSYCKTFASRCLSNGLLNAARRVAVEGFFQNQVLRSRLTDSVGTLEKMGARIAAFEEGAAGNARSGASALRSALDELAKGRGHADSAERLASGMDDRAKDMVAADIKALRLLAECIMDILKDFKKPTPELVSNIKTLASSQQKALVPTLVKGYNDTVRFLKIMQAYVVIPNLESTDA